jgi:hypothetical protein
MSKESFEPNQLFSVPPDRFRTHYRALSPEELAELGESPITAPAVPEEIRARQDNFLKNTFEYWDKNSAPQAKIEGESWLPADQNWQQLETDINPAKFGEYTVNPETQTLDFEKAKVFIPDLSSFKGKKLSEVAEHLIKTYGAKYYIPGIEYWQWIYDHKDLESLPTGKEFETLKKELNDNVCFLFGTTLRDSDGHWYVPYVHWDSGKWHRRACWLGHDWYSDYRVVLLEK